uniref:Uncharacterized protein n=1 Tax=Strongyloides venezuelensis TaxID=75913 RepID=A0A0K0FGH1_STRVS
MSIVPSSQLMFGNHYDYCRKLRKKELDDREAKQELIERMNILEIRRTLISRTEPKNAKVDNTHNKIEIISMTLLKVGTANLKEVEKRLYIVPNLTFNIILERFFFSKYSKYIHSYEKHTVTIKMLQCQKHESSFIEI